MRALFAELRRVLADDGTCWINLGDSYSARADASAGESSRRDRANVLPSRIASGIPPKNTLGIPWRVAFALQDDGWILRNALIWHKPNAKPESVTDRLSNRYEHVFLFSRSRRYHFDLDSIREAPGDYTGVTWAQRKASGEPNRRGTTPRTREMTQFASNREGKNPGDVWTIPTSPFAEAHFATMPPALAERCILAGCKPGGVVLDPFSGSGTTGLAATKHGRRYVGIDLNAEYLDLSLRTRLAQTALTDGVGA